MAAGRPRKSPVSNMQAYHIIKALEDGMDRTAVKSKYNVGERQLRDLEAGEKRRKKRTQEPLQMPLVPSATARQTIINAVARARRRHGLPPATVQGTLRVKITQDMIDEVEEMSA